MPSLLTAFAPLAHSPRTASPHLHDLQTPVPFLAATTMEQLAEIFDKMLPMTTGPPVPSVQDELGGKLRAY